MVSKKAWSAAEGTLKGGWDVRAERVAALVGHLFGPEGPGDLERLDGLEAVAPISGPSHRFRASMEAAARAQLRALLARDVEALARAWAPQVWVLWPDGTLALHPRQALAEALGTREGSSAPLELRATRSYVGGEIHAAHARGVGRELRFLGGGGWVTTALEGPQLEVRRVLLVAEGASERPLFTTLALGAPDEARMFGAGPKVGEGESEKLADRFVRALLHRRGRGVLEQKGRLTSKLLIDELETSPDELADRLDHGEPAFEANEYTLGQVQRVSDRQAAATLGKPAFDALQTKAPELWHEDLLSLAPEWVLVESGRYAPAEERLVGQERRLCLLLNTAEPDGTGRRARRMRLALCTKLGRTPGGPPSSSRVPIRP